MKYTIPKIILDAEIYKDYCHFGFKNKETENLVQLEVYEGHPLDYKRLFQVMTKSRTMGFNSNHYDLPMTWLAISLAKRYQGEDLCQRLKRASDQIIKGGLKSWQFMDLHNLRAPKVDHVDLFDVAPGMASLKIYGGRVHSIKMQDLPIEHTASITVPQRSTLLVYNDNDLETTGDLRKQLVPQLKLRCDMSKQYGQDLRSKSDAQIAEAVINSEMKKLTGIKPGKANVKIGTTFRYNVPEFIKYKTSVMRDALEMIRSSDFMVGQGGKVDLPKHIKDNHITIGNSVYRMGIGGLHSSESSVTHHAGDDHILVDRDVASYYPRIILNQGLYPAHMGKLFLKVYNSIVERRLKAKREGDKVVAESLKITINGSFGKFGSMWSTLYAPPLLIQTTVTGQLALLMLIEAIELAGISVVSANTDGVVIKCHKSKVSKLNVIVAEWEKNTNFETEETPYKSLLSRDVNNYIAIHADPIPDGKGGFYYAKTKGAFAEAGLQKNPTNWICVRAMVDYVVHGTPIEDTIYASTDVRDFVSIRQVKGGGYKQWSEHSIPAHRNEKDLLRMAGWEEVETFTKNGRSVMKWTNAELSRHHDAWTLAKAYKTVKQEYFEKGDEEYLGKAVRWVYCTDSPGPIRYKLNGNNVPKTEGAFPLMELPDEIPENIDYDWYIREAKSLLVDVGYVHPPESNSVPEDIADLI